MSDPVMMQGKEHVHSIAVFSGDKACIRSVVRYWSGQHGIKLLERMNKPFQLRSDHAAAEITIITDYQVVMPAWTGGPLVWLLPERGPSEPELAQMRHFLSIHHGVIPSFVVLLCIPAGTPKDEVERDLDIVSETLSSSIETDVDVRLEAVWLEQNVADSLGLWLKTLRGANGK